LSSERGWLAIDPKGVVGDPGFEVGAFLSNPKGPKTQRLLDRRLDILAELLGYDRRRLKEWAFGFMVLSAFWSAESGRSVWESEARLAAFILSQACRARSGVFYRYSALPRRASPWATSISTVSLM